MKTFSVSYQGKDYDLRYLAILDAKFDLIKIDLRGTALSEIAGGILEIRRQNNRKELLTWPDRLTLPDDFKSAIQPAILAISEGINVSRGQTVLSGESQQVTKMLS